MTDDLAKVVVRELQAMHLIIDDIREDIRDLTIRLAAAEKQPSVANGRMERFDARLARVDRRLAQRVA